VSRSLTFGGFARRASRCAPTRLTGEPVQPPLTARVTIDDVVPGVHEDRAEHSAHQTRTENADTHVRVLYPARSTARICIAFMRPPCTVTCDSGAIKKHREDSMETSKEAAISSLTGKVPILARS
jgi:nitrate reductase beta subunit